MKTGRVLAAVVSITLALTGRARAMHPDEYVPPLHWNGRAVVLPSSIFRNGDWFAVGAVGIVALSSFPNNQLLLATSRAEVGVAGADVALGLGAILGPTSSRLNEALMAGGLLSVEGRVARMYGPTSWQRTNYAGVQVELALPYGMTRVTAGEMVDLRDHADKRLQLGLGVSF